MVNVCERDEPSEALAEVLVRSINTVSSVSISASSFIVTTIFAVRFPAEIVSGLAAIV